MVRDSQGVNRHLTGTVTLTGTDPVGYVDSSAVPAGADGSFAHAFQTAGAAATAAAANIKDPNSAQNDTIFVYNRSATYAGGATGITLASGEKLLGDGSSLTSVNGNTVGASSTNPTFSLS